MPRNKQFAIFATRTYLSGVCNISQNYKLRRKWTSFCESHGESKWTRSSR